jgi:tetratricopeptide (TPR) repeat protein
MSRSLLTAALIAALAAPAAGDNIWKNAVSPNDPVIDNYNLFMQKGDEAAVAGMAMGVSQPVVLKQVEIALDAYRSAAKARPKTAEPYFRMANVLHAFFFDCELRPNDKQPPPKSCDLKIPKEARARELLDAWDKFEALAPLDSRVNEILQTRAITRTKMVGLTNKPTGLLEAAAKDYRALLDRDDGMLRLDQGGLALVLGNLAETYMMLGDIDQAIDTYVAAHRAGADGTTLLGLAVALDRDERGPEALRLIRNFGADNFQNFQNRYSQGDIFFVPAGEEEYYFALGHEAFGEISEAVEHWRAFIASGAHPKFQPRAKEHLDKLSLRRNVQIKSPITPDLGRVDVIAPRSPFDPAAPKQPKRRP